MNEASFTALTLFDRYVRESVIGGSQQVPLYQMIQNSGHEGGDFVFFPRPVAPAAPVENVPSAPKAAGVAASSTNESTTKESTLSLTPIGTAPKTGLPSGLRYVRVPPGHSVVGGTTGANSLHYLPPIDFQTDGFWMGETEVTVRAYLQFARTTGRSVPSPPVIAGKVFNKNWTSTDFPMVMVDWRDASDFCQWDGGRLPSEFEWEYAARGGTSGPAYGPIDDIAWWANNSGPHAIDSGSIWNDQAKKNWARYERMIVEQGVTIHPVGQKAANNFGLRDMLGNVVEWAADSYTPNGAEKVVRGGAWGFIGPQDVAERDRYAPTMRNGYLGFRCVLPP
jgi:formylglycine-generating enzyme required for sulfatase activity